MIIRKSLHKIITLACVIFTLEAQADVTEEAEAVFQNFFDSFTNADPAAIVSLFSDDALFWGTGSQILVQDPEGIASYFSGLGNLQPGDNVASAADISIIPLGEDQAMVSGTWQVVPRGKSVATLLRVSAVVALRDSKWKIVQFHNSTIPE